MLRSYRGSVPYSSFISGTLSVLRPVVDLSQAIDFSLLWRNDNASPLLARFVAGVTQNSQNASASIARGPS
jgi:hypothetical protein